MIDHPLALLLFLAANLTIVAGYLYLALTIVPMVRVKLKRTKIGGVGFFLLCGATHLDLALTGLLDPDMTMGHMLTSWHMVAIHVPQAICVWVFVTGLYIELGRAEGLSGLGE